MILEASSFPFYGRRTQYAFDPEFGGGRGSGRSGGVWLVDDLDIDCGRHISVIDDQLVDRHQHEHGHVIFNVDGDDQLDRRAIVKFDDAIYNLIQHEDWSLTPRLRAPLCRRGRAALFFCRDKSE